MKLLLHISPGATPTSATYQQLEASEGSPHDEEVPEKRKRKRLKSPNVGRKKAKSASPAPPVLKEPRRKIKPRPMLTKLAHDDKVRLMSRNASVFVKVDGAYVARLDNFDSIISTLVSAAAGNGLTSFLPVAFQYIILTWVQTLNSIPYRALADFLNSFDNTV